MAKEWVKISFLTNNVESFVKFNPDKTVDLFTMADGPIISDLTIEKLLSDGEVVQWEVTDKPQMKTVKVFGSSLDINGFVVHHISIPSATVPKRVLSTDTWSFCDADWKADATTPPANDAK